MSSTAYFANVYPDPKLRRLVLASGVLLTLIGVPLLATLPVYFMLRIAALFLWVALAARELSRLRQGWQGCHALRFAADGEIAVQTPARNWQPARLVAGGILLRRVGWIRLSIDLESGGTLVCAELICGDGRESADWRRLQVIWRHVGA